ASYAAASFDRTSSSRRTTSFTCKRANLIELVVSHNEKHRTAQAQRKRVRLHRGADARDGAAAPARNHARHDRRGRGGGPGGRGLRVSPHAQGEGQPPAGERPGGGRSAGRDAAAARPGQPAASTAAGHVPDGS